MEAMFVHLLRQQAALRQMNLPLPALNNLLGQQQRLLSAQYGTVNEALQEAISDELEKSVAHPTFRAFPMAMAQEVPYIVANLPCVYTSVRLA